MHRLHLRFEEHRQKHRRRCYFKNIASLRKKQDVLDYVLGSRNSIQSYEKTSGYLAKNVTLNSFDLPKIHYLCMEKLTLFFTF